MTIKKMWLAVLSLTALLFVGCSDKIDPKNPPMLELDTYQLNIDGGGGDIPLFYAVKNPVKNAKPEVVSGVDWISAKEITSSTIVLHIAESNSNEERFASITVKYPGMEQNVRVNVLQDKQTLNKFKFEVSDIDYNSCKVKYIPTDKNMPYMANIIDAEYFKQSGVTDYNVFIDTEMASYRALAERNQMTLQELMGRVSPQLIYTGNAEREFSGMKHGSQYVVYSYGITFHGNEYTVTTPMHQTLVNIPMPDMYNVSFSITAQMNGNMASIYVEPKNWDGYYNVQIAPDDSLYYIEPGNNPSDGLMRSIASFFYDQARQALAGGATVEKFLSTACHKGSKQINMTLDTSKRYMIYVFAVDSENGSIPVMRSTPEYTYL